MKAHTKLLVGLYALLVAIGTVRGSNVKVSTNDIIEIIGDYSLTEEKWVSSTPTNSLVKSGSFLNMKAPILSIPVDESPENYSAPVRLINYFMPRIGDIVEHKPNFKLFQYEGGSLISYQTRYLLKSIETRDVLSWSFRIGSDSELEIVRFELVGPSLKENVLIMVCFKHSW